MQRSALRKHWACIETQLGWYDLLNFVLCSVPRISYLHSRSDWNSHKWSIEGVSGMWPASIKFIIVLIFISGVSQGISIPCGSVIFNGARSTLCHPR